MIYDELLHIKALSHLSTMVKRELAGVLVFEAHWNAGKVCKRFSIPPLSDWRKFLWPTDRPKLHHFDLLYN